jgi:hypothetical protein
MATEFPLRLVRLATTLLLLTASVPASLSARDKQIPKAVRTAKPQTLPVTTTSAAAARYFENGMLHYEAHRWNLALNDWHEAVKVDPNFALAYTWI